MPLNICKRLSAVALLLTLTACATHRPATMAMKSTLAAPAGANNGDVQIFSLDDPAPDSPAPNNTAPNNAAGGGMHAAPPVDNGTESALSEPAGNALTPDVVALPGDANVIVYPLTGDAPGGSTFPMLTTSSAPSSISLAPQPAPEGNMAASSSAADPVYFADNSARLNRAAHHAVKDAAHNGGAVVSVEGHASVRAATADPVAARIVNLKLSMQRAITVSRQLVANGVAPDAIRLTAYGDTHPAAPMDGKSAEAASRRVEIRASPTGNE